MSKQKTELMKHLDKMNKIYQKNGSVVGSIDPPPTNEEHKYAEKLGFYHEIRLGPSKDMDDKETPDYIDVFSKMDD